MPEVVLYVWWRGSLKMRRFKQEKCIKGQAWVSRPVKVDMRFFWHFSHCFHNHKVQNTKIKHMKMNQVLEARLGFFCYFTLQTICSKVSTRDGLGSSEILRRGGQKHWAGCTVDLVQKLDHVATDCHLKAPGPLEEENSVKLTLMFTQEN